MEQQQLVNELAGMVGPVPETVEVLGLQQHTPDAVEQRMQRLLDLVGDRIGVRPERRDRVREDDRSVFRLPLGGRITGYHASGAVHLSTGLPPMERLIGPERARDELLAMVQPAAELLDMPGWTGRDEELVFERLWQIKACAADPGGTRAAPVVCRAVGAYRHVVRGLPVLGSASAAVQVAADSQIDTVRVFVRLTTGNVLDTPRSLEPQEAALRAVRQLNGLIPEAGRSFSDIATPVSFRFGYLSLSKRAPQSLLAPMYVAEVRTDGEESMSYLAAVPGTETEYLPLSRVGSGPATSQRRPPH